jgi:2-oxoglutarate dehydrogenase E2 component (dihydrolipoamide succinyltransferase)
MNRLAPVGAPLPAGGLPGATPENPLAMGVPSGPPAIQVPVNPIRLGMAQSMDTMKNTSTPITVVAEVDASRLKALHDQFKPSFERDTGIPLTYMPFFARATALALQAHPIMNAMSTPQGYVIPRSVHLGIAMQVPGGILIPTVWNAESKQIPHLAKEIAEARQRAQAGLVRGDETAGSTFVITNTGRYGQTLFGTPTIKPPNVGCLAFESIMKRPVVTEHDRIEARPMMYLALTADHRAVDGQDMTAFLGKVKQVLENVAF